MGKDILARIVFGSVWGQLHTKHLDKPLKTVVNSQNLQTIAQTNMVPRLN